MSERRYPDIDIQNEGADKDFNGFPMREQVGFDGKNLQRKNADALNYKIVTVGNDKFVGIAAPGTAQTTTKWQCRKISDDGAGTITITWANGGSFDQAVTSIESLIYS